ncbi:unnamed protein product [Brachionus calyciflorus]|uniref:Ig-like domain-containing protein n=1 Tax=Brachionus calyciflorus TaxID=104777 RepID=A0A813MNV0_9BILA|nr:unnamed protein product [Brachionus calyciflorus]
MQLRDLTNKLLVLFILVDLVLSKKIYNQRGPRPKGTKRQEKSLSSLIPEEPEFEYNSIILSDPFYNLFDNQNSQRFPNTLYISVILGQDVVLPCSVKNLGLYNILWLRLKDGDVLAYDNITVTQDSRFKLTKKTEYESNLMIQETKLSDTGEYACQINTQNVKSRIINLMVLKSPVFSEIELTNEIPDQQFAALTLSKNLTENQEVADYLSAKSINVVEGKQITLECNAFGQPKPAINWYVKRFKSDNLTVYILNSSKIFVNNVMRNQYDYFECEATNKVPPSVSKKFKINVLYRPEITVSPSKVYVQQIPTQIRFNCTVEAYPSADIIWMFNYRNLKGVNYYGAKQLRQINRHSIKNSKYRKKEKLFDSRNVIKRSDLLNTSSNLMHKYKITENLINETLKQSSLVVNVENENDFGTYECFSNNTAGSKFVKFHIYGDIRSTTAYNSITTRKVLVVNTPPQYLTTTGALSKTSEDNTNLMTEEIIIPQKNVYSEQFLNEENENLKEENESSERKFFGKKNIKEESVINFSTSLINDLLNKDDSKKSWSDYVLGNSNGLSSLSPKTFSFFNYLFLLVPYTYFLIS